MFNCGEAKRRCVGRPTREQAAAIDDRVLRGARDAFCRQGIAGASMEEIAAAVGVTKHTIYRRYPSKAALLNAVVERDLAELRAFAADGIPVDGDPVEALRLTACRYYERCITPEKVAMMGFLSAEGAFSEDMRHQMMLWEQLAIAPLRERVLAAQASGRLRPGDPGEICGILGDLMHGAARRFAVRGPQSPEAIGRQFEDRWQIFARAMLVDAREPVDA